MNSCAKMTATAITGFVMLLGIRGMGQSVTLGNDEVNLSAGADFVSITTTGGNGWSYIKGTMKSLNMKQKCFLPNPTNNRVALTGTIGIGKVRGKFKKKSEKDKRYYS